MAYRVGFIDTNEPFHDTDVEPMANAELYGVIEGCAVTLDGGNMTLDVATGFILHSGTLVTVAATTNAVTLVSDSSNPRWTALRVNGSGTISIVSGTAASSPSKPELGDFTLIEWIYVDANLTVASNASYSPDKRHPVREIFRKGADIASSSTIAPSGYLIQDITGTTSITAINKAPAGWIQFYQFDGALTFTHNGTSLDLAGGANVTTAAGDVIGLYCIDGTNWREFTRNMAAVTLTIWVQPHAVSGATATLSSTDNNAGLAKLGSASADGTAHFAIPIPSGFITLTKAVAIGHPNSDGALRWSVATNFGANGEGAGVHTDSISTTQVTVTNNELEELDISSAFTGIAAGDYVGLAFTREGADAGDTITAFHLFGILLEYK